MEKTPTPTHVESDEPVQDVESSRYLAGWRLAFVTVSLALGMFLTGVDSTIIGVATPGITTSFKAIDDLAWYGSGYMLPHTVLQPILGSFYKSFNIRYIYLVSIIIFEVGSILCAAAPTSTAFIIGRVVAGCGAAGILQGTLTIVGLSVPKKKVPMYYGYILSVQGISSCSAPIFGGIFTDKVTWRWCFWINVPIGAFALAMVLLLVKPQQSNPSRALPVLERLTRMDWFGTLIFLSAFLCLFLTLQWGGQTKPWDSSEVIGLFVGFGLLLALFALTQYFMGDGSLIPPRILKQRTVLFGTVYLILFGIHITVYLQYIPIYFQAIRGTSALNSGIRMIALDAARVVFIVISGALVTRFGHYMPYMAVGTIIGVVAAGLLTTLDLNTTTAYSTAFLFLAGVGAGIGGIQPFTALQAALKTEDDLAIGNGLTVFGLQLGTALAFAISQPVFLTRIFEHLSANPLTSHISRASIIAAGATHLNRLVDNAEALEVLRKAYSLGIRDTMIVSLVAIALGVLCLPGMEWLKLQNADENSDEEEMLLQMNRVLKAMALESDVFNKVVL